MEDGPAPVARRAAEAVNVETFTLSNAPGHLIRRCQQRAVDLFVVEAGEKGPTPRQFAVLINVYQNDGINQTDLVRLSGIDRSSLTEILRRLIGRGLIARRRVETDHRTNALSITDAGRAMLEGAFEAALRVQERILAPVPSSRRTEAIELLTLLAGDSDGAPGHNGGSNDA